MTTMSQAYTLGNTTSPVFPANCSSSSDSKDSSTGIFVTGLIIAILGSTGEQLGLTLWKLAENRIQKRRDDRRQLDLEFDGKENSHDKEGSLVDHPGSLEDADNVAGFKEFETCSRDKSIKISRADNESDSTVPDHSKSQKPLQCHIQFDGSEDTSRRSAPTSSRNGDKSDPDTPSSPSMSGPGPNASTSSLSTSGSRLESIKLWCIEKEAFICVLAFALFAAGNGLNFVALGLIQESIVTLTGAWALVINIVTAKFLLGEELNNLDGVSVFLIIAGITMSILGSKHKSTKWCGSRTASPHLQA